MIAVSPPVRLLAEALRPALALGAGAGLGADMLAAAIRRHRVGALLHRAACLNAAAFPQAVRSALRGEFDRSTVRVLQQKAAMQRLSPMLATCGIAFAEIKGWRLGDVLYGGEALRHSKDVDLLVETERLPEVIDLLASAGYLAAGEVPLDPRRARATLRFHREVPVHDPATGVQIELHSRALTAPPPGWSDAPLLHGARDLTCPHYVLYLLLHGAGSHWKRLKWLCDLVMIAQLTAPEVREQVVAKARQFDCAAALAASFHLAAALWGEPPVESWLRELALPQDDPAVARHLAAYDAALNRKGRLTGTELLARRLELIRDPPLFGSRYPSRLKAMSSRAALWFLRNVG